MEFNLSELSSIKTLARALHCAAKIGDDIMVTGGNNEIEMRTLNSSHSSSAKFRFPRSFFEKLVLPRSELDIKVPVRSLISVCRSPASILSLRMRWSPNATSLMFICTSKTSLTKTYFVPILEGCLGLTLFNKKSCSCMLQTRARFFIDLIGNFHGKLDEITFAPSANKMRIASFVDDMASTTNRILRTEMTVDVQEFEVHRYSKQHDVMLTIFCKYFRAVLEFCDHFESSMRMWYEATGHPMLFELELGSPGDTSVFHAEFVFATRHTEAPTASAPTPEISSSQHLSQSNERRDTSQITRQRPRTFAARKRIPTATPPARSPLQPTSDPVQLPSTRPHEPAGGARRVNPAEPTTDATIRQLGHSHISETLSEAPNLNTVIDSEERPSSQPATKVLDRRSSERLFHSHALDQSEQKIASQVPMKDSNQESTLDESVPETPKSQQLRKSRISLAAGTTNIPSGLLAEEEADSSEDDDEFVEGTPPPN